MEVRQCRDTARLADRAGSPGRRAERTPHDKGLEQCPRVTTRKKHRRRERAVDGIECGCCLFDVFGVVAVLSVLAIGRGRARAAT